MYFHSYQNGIFLILGHKYQNYLIVEMHHPDMLFKSENLIEVAGTTEKYNKEIRIEKY